MLAHAPKDLKRPAMACLFNASANDPLAAEAMLAAGMLKPSLELLDRATEDEPPGNLTPNPNPNPTPTQPQPNQTQTQTQTQTLSLSLPQTPTPTLTRRRGLGRRCRAQHLIRAGRRLRYPACRAAPGCARRPAQLPRAWGQPAAEFQRSGRADEPGGEQRRSHGRCAAGRRRRAPGRPARRRQGGRAGGRQRRSLPRRWRPRQPPARPRRRGDPA